MPRVAIITRSCYPELMTESTLERFKTFLQSFKDQTNQSFVIYVIWEELYGKTGKDENRLLMGDIVNELGMKNVWFDKFPKYTYEVEGRFDNDDTASPDYIQRIHDIYNSTKEHTFCINFQPLKHHLKTGKLYYHERTYNYEGTSMFVCIVQKGEKIHYVYQRPHIYMAKELGSVVMGGYGYCFLTCHEDNQLTKIHGNEKEWVI